MILGQYLTSVQNWRIKIKENELTTSLVLVVSLFLFFLMVYKMMTILKQNNTYGKHVVHHLTFAIFKKIMRNYTCSSFKKYMEYIIEFKIYNRTVLEDRKQMFGNITLKYIDGKLEYLLSYEISTHIE